MKSAILENAVQVLAKAPMCFVATAANNEPRVRPFQYQFEQDGKLWFCTGKSKDVFKQLQSNPSVEICAVHKGTWVRVSGMVTLQDDRAVKERILAGQPLIKNIYGSADNPDFATFHIEHGACMIADFYGNPPQTGTF